MQVSKLVERDVCVSMKLVTVDIVNDTAKRSQSYIDAYASKSSESFLSIENHVKLKKHHQNVLDLETTYLKEMLQKIDTHAK